MWAKNVLAQNFEHAFQIVVSLIRKLKMCDTSHKLEDKN